MYDKLVGEKDNVYWDKFIWNKLAVPKYRVINWLAMHRRLKTADILAQLGLISNANCNFYCNHIESHAHLFFQCVIVRQILAYVYDWLGVKSTQFQLHRILLFMNRRSKRTKVQKQVVAVGITATVYLVWWARNEVIWNMVVWRPEKIFKLIQQCIVLVKNFYCFT